SSVPAPPAQDFGSVLGMATRRRATFRAHHRPMTHRGATSPESEAQLMNDPAPATVATSTLSSRRGVAILLLLSIVQFMDILDASILNIALPSIKSDLGFSQQSLQWVINGYILTYGGFLLLGGRMADLLGRRSVLVSGLIVFAGPALLGACLRLIRWRVRSARLANFDALGALLVTGGMLLLVYTLVKAPDVGWGAERTVGGLAGAAVLLAGFAFNELRVRNPLVPLSILKVKGVAAADATQLVAIAGFLPMFFFLTLYMQTVLGYSPIQTGLAYLPLTGGFIIAASISSQLFARIGTMPVVVLRTVISAAGLYWLSRVPVVGSYVASILPGLLVVSIGMGGVFTGLTTAAN